MHLTGVTTNDSKSNNSTIHGENSDEEKSLLLRDKQNNDKSVQASKTQTKDRLSNTFSRLHCITTILLTLVAIPVIVIAAVLGLKTMETTSPQNTAVILKDYSVLIDEFTPSVSYVTFSSNAATVTSLYRTKCNDLAVYNQTKTQFKTFNTTANQTYAISTHYLVNASKLLYHFNFVSSNFSNKSECIAIVYFFHNITSYNNFLEYESTSDANSTYCLKSLASSYTLMASKTDYYLLGLFIPNTSIVEQVEINSTGYELQYFINSTTDPDCTLFENSENLTCKIYGDTNTNICILGEILNFTDSAQISYNSTVEHYKRTIIIEASNYSVILFLFSILCIATCIKRIARCKTSMTKQKRISMKSNDHHSRSCLGNKDSQAKKLDTHQS